MTVLEIHHLSKSYGQIRALDDFNLEINEGEVYGILGPNGSGKTTLLGILSGVLAQDGGTFSWFQDREELPNLRIGTLLETPNFYPYLNADENLDIVRQIKRLPPMDFSELLDLVKLKDRRNSRFSTYSLGMKQRLAIAATMIGDPDVLIYDEPTNGLDPEGIAEVRQILNNIASTGKTVVMASHILHEVEKICSHVAIIKKGQLLATGPVGMILGHLDIVEIKTNDLSRLEDWCSKVQFIKQYARKGDLIELEIEPDVLTEDITRSIQDSGMTITHILRKKRSLEDEFLQITKNRQ